MSGYDGSIKIDSNINSKGFNKGINSISSTVKKLGVVIATAFSVKTVADFGKECVKLGSDLAEVQNVVDVAFKTMNGQVNEFAQNAIEQFGLSQLVTKKYMGTFGAMANSFKFSEAAAFEMSKTLTGLAGDVASFYNISSDEAYTKLKSVFTGETETLKELGVVMTQNALDQYALEKGYGKTTAKMSEQEKVALRYKFVVEQLSMASGDFERTQNSWANQTRILSLRFNELKSTIGQGLINVLSPALQVINSLLAKLQVLANTFKSFTDLISGNVNKSSNGMGSLADTTSDATKNMSDLGDATEKAGKKAEGALASFDDLEVLSSSDSNEKSDSGIGSDIGNLSLSNSQIGSEVEISQNLLNKFEELKALFEPVCLAWENKGQSVIVSLSNAFNGLKLIVEGIGSSFETVWTNGTGQKAVETILGIVQSIFDIVGNIGTAWADAWNNENTGTKIVQNISDSFNNLLDIIKKICDTYKEFTQSEDFKEYTNALTQAFEKVSGWIKKITDMLVILWDNGGKETFTKLLEVCGKIGELINAIATALDPIIKILILAVEPIIQGIIKAVGGLLDILSGTIDFLTGVFTQDWDKIWLGIQETFEGVWNAIEGLLDVMTVGLYSKSKSWSEDCKNALEDNWNKFKDSFGEIWNNVTNIAQDQWSQMQDNFGKAKDGFVNIQNSLKEKSVEIFNNIKSAIVNIQNGLKDKTLEIYNNIKNGILNIIENVKGGLRDKLNNIKDTFINVFNNIWSNIRGILNNIIGGIERNGQQKC